MDNNTTIDVNATSWNTTPSIEDVDVDVIWRMPFTATMITVVYMGANLTVGLSANSLLIVIINHSPTLKTPANSHLINICANNLVLCLCIAISLVSILLPADLKNKINILTGFHIFLISNCFLQYWGTFASIGFYRSKIIQCPPMTLKRRRQIISRCLTTSWVVSLLVSLMVCLSHIDHDVYACSTLNPFQKSFLVCGEGEHKLSTQRIGVALINIMVFLIVFVIIFVSYHKVFRTLNRGKQFGRNKIFPLSRSFSLPSVLGDTIQNPPSATTPVPDQEPAGDKSPYTVRRSDQPPGEGEFVVHYQRSRGLNSLTYEDIIALENPILASNMRRQAQQKRTLQLTRSNASNASVKSKCPEFTDISAGADLQRYQNIKNSSALRNHFLKRDRVGFNSATKNSLVMLSSFVVCSLPMFVCIIPTILSNNKESHRVLIILFTKLMFFLNAPIYPLWYLVQNKRVRKCLVRVTESMLVKMDLRR